VLGLDRMLCKESQRANHIPDGQVCIRRTRASRHPGERRQLWRMDTAPAALDRARQRSIPYSEIVNGSAWVREDEFRTS